MRALIVSSTPSKHPTGGLAWVRATIAAVDELAPQGTTFITSLGTAPWDLVLCSAGQAGARVHVIAPVPKNASTAELARITQDYGLRPELTTWEPLHSMKSTGRRKDVWTQRDETAFAAADIVFPISIKPGGRIESWLAHCQATVDDRFRVPWQKPDAAPRTWTSPGPWIAPSQWPQDALLHLTRSSDGPWPAESMRSYWSAVASSKTRYPRDGFSTLCRILEERRIRASQFRIRARAATVSLTALDPSQTHGLFRWRSRFARYSFEPYAIAVARQAAVRLGARAVRYDDGAQNAAPDPFRQGRGEHAHWEAEQEWRTQGDLDLSAISPAELGAIAATDEEAGILRERFPGLQVACYGATFG